jgi:hypothetical protein
MAVDRKVPRLFAFPPEVELRTLQGVGLKPEEEAVLRAVLLSFCAIARAKISSSEVLEPIVEGCRHHSVIVRSASLHRLVVLSHYFESAARGLEELCRHRDASLRVLALTYAANGPSRLLVRIIGEGLGAQELEVRRAAVRLGHGLHSRRCQRLLNRRLEVEPDAGIRQLIQSAIAVQTSKNMPS